MSGKNLVVIGDSRNMAELENESVQLIITSPPYWQLKDYGEKNQICFDDSYEDYINNLNLVWSECIRVLEQGCRMCINIGDQFARSVFYGRYKVIPIRTEIIRFCETSGMDYMGSIIWQKATTTNTSGGGTVMGSYPYPRNGIVRVDYEFILIFKKYGSGPKVSQKTKNLSKMTKKEWNEYFSGHWSIPGVKQKKHLAMFPVEIPSRLIKMYSFVGDTVLDPFLGSGTTSLAASDQDRNSAGYEINEKFLPVIKKKLAVDQGTLFLDREVEIVKQEKPRTDYDSRLLRLPYRFRDPVKVEKKGNIKKKTFGSKIDGSEKADREYFSVEVVESPEIIKLKSGPTVRLIGVTEIAAKKQEAIKFLREKTAGTKVYLKYGRVKEDEAGNARAYVYLKNRTFLNAHLIKKGLADVDMETDFKHKNRFVGYTGKKPG